MAVVAIRDLFETHLTVSDLDRAVRFYRDVLGLPVAGVFPERRVAFLWVGGAGEAMLGLWETGTGPQQLRLHLAFYVNLNGPPAFRLGSRLPVPNPRGCILSGLRFIPAK